MRLTVHVKNVKKETLEIKTKEGMVKKTKLFNTLSFNNVSENDVPIILDEIEKENLGTPTKYYLSGERISGHARKRKKA